MKTNRKPTNILELRTARLTIVLGPGQRFYETKNAYEVWDESPLRRVHRIPKSSVLWVLEEKPRVCSCGTRV